MEFRKIIASAFIAAGRALEFMLTGQSDFRITTEAFEGHQTVQDLAIGKKVLEELKYTLNERFGIEIKRPVVLELVKKGKLWDYNFAWLEESLGKCKSHVMIDDTYHLVYVLSGMKKERFKAVLAHELAHAYQHETGLFPGSRVLREGLARWIEYKILLQEGEKAEAEKLLNLKNWIYGKGIIKMVKLEQETGEQNLIKSLRAIDRSA